MSSKFCHNCGMQLSEGVRFCPRCGQNLTFQSGHNQESYEPAKKDKGSLNESKPGLLNALAIVINIAAFFSIGGIAYDAKQIVWHAHMNGYSNLVGGAEIHNFMLGSMFASALTAIMLLALGINKYSKLGNYLMLLGSVITLSVAIYQTNSGIGEWATVFNLLVWLWFSCSMIYIWTSLYKAYTYTNKTSDTKSTPILLCVGLSALYILWFIYTAFSYGGVINLS